MTKLGSFPSFGLLGLRVWGVGVDQKRAGWHWLRPGEAL